MIETLNIEIFSKSLADKIRKVKLTGKPEVYSYYSRAYGTFVETHLIYKVKESVFIECLTNGQIHQIEFPVERIEFSESEIKESYLFYYL